MDLTTIDRYLTLFPGASPTASDNGVPEQIGMRITAVSKTVEKYLKRGIEIKERTAKFTPLSGSGTRQIRLPAYPINELGSITVFGEELVVDDEYVVNNEDGVLSFNHRITRCQAPFSDSIVATWTGGMALDTASFIEEYPDIEVEVLMQVRFEMMRHKDIAMKSVSNGQSSSSLVAYGLLESLRECLDRYARIDWAQ